MTPTRAEHIRYYVTIVLWLCALIGFSIATNGFAALCLLVIVLVEREPEEVLKNVHDHATALRATVGGKG